MADMVREDHDQAYTVVLAEQTQSQKHEEFSGQKVYEMMLALFTEKRDRIYQERESKIERLAEEKTEWYRLLALQKGEPMQFHIEKLVYDKDVEKLKKVNAHLTEQNRFESDALNPDKVVIREGLVKQNDQQLTKLIEEKLRKDDPTQSSTNVHSPAKHGRRKTKGTAA